MYTPNFTRHIRSWLLRTPVTNTIPGGAYVVSNQNLRCTQKPIYTPILTRHIRSWLLRAPGPVGLYLWWFLLFFALQHVKDLREQHDRAIQQILMEKASPFFFFSFFFFLLRFSCFRCMLFFVSWLFFLFVSCVVFMFCVCGLHVLCVCSLNVLFRAKSTDRDLKKKKQKHDHHPPLQKKEMLPTVHQHPHIDHSYTSVLLY